MTVQLADFLAGWISGFLVIITLLGTVGLIVSHPLETIKVRQQNYNKGALHTLTETLRYEGPRGLFKGILLPLLTIGPYNSVFFGTYCTCLRALQDNKDSSGRIDVTDPHWLANIFIAGNLAGLVQAGVFCPVEVVKTVLQSNVSSRGEWLGKKVVRCRTMTQCLKQIVAVGGVRWLFRGLTPLLCRDVVTSGGYMVTYEYLFHSPPYNLNDTVEHLIAGSAAGFVSWAFVTPFDVVKSRMQSDNAYEPHYSGMVDCFRKLYRHEGLGIFHKGYAMMVLRGCVLNAVVFLVFEHSLVYLDDNKES